ncbi:hypothetical protein R3I94_006877 [Phoxinus phoxinus]
MFSALLGRRPMAPGELQAKVRKLMTTPARPAVPAVSTSVRDQRPSVPPPPPTTEVTDEELVQMATDLETAHVQVLQSLPLPLVVRPPSPPPPALSSIPPPPLPPPPRLVAAAPPTLAVPARAPALTREEPRRVSVEETPSGEATLAPQPAKRKRKEGKVEQPATPTPASAESRLPESWRTALTVEEQEWIGRELFKTDSGGRTKLTTDLKLSLHSASRLTSCLLRVSAVPLDAPASVGRPADML